MPTSALGERNSETSATISSTTVCNSRGSERGETNYADCPDTSAPKERLISNNGDFFNAQFKTMLSMRYHSKRRSFFERINELSRSVSAISAAGAITTILSSHESLSIAFGAAVAISSSLDLVFDFTRRSRLYDDLYKKFCDIMVRLESDSYSSIRQFNVDFLKIAADEPTTLNALSLICHNEVCTSMGIKSDMYNVHWIYRILCHFISFSDMRPKKVEEKNG